MRIVRIVALAIAVLVSTETSAGAQVLIKVNEDVTFKLGVLGQFQADWLEDPVEEGTQQNLFLRRARLLFGGQVAKNLSFFVETDTPNLGRTLPGGKNINPQVVVQDAYGEWMLRDGVALDFGLMFVPFSRNSIQSAATLLPIDYGAYTFSTSAATQSTIGRDTGAQVKGYAAGDRVEYRLGAFQGARDARSHRSFRYAGRLQVQLLEPEPRGFFYAGTHLGRRRTAAIGGGFDTQSDYLAYVLDAFLDHPLGGGALTTQAAWNRIDGDTTFLTLPKQNVVLLEVGYLLPGLRLTPVVQFTRRDILDSVVGDERRWSVGVNYWWAGHNANVKTAYGRIAPRGVGDQHQFTIQLQFFYF